MVDALTSKKMSPELLKVAERAKREPEGKFHSLAHLLTEESLDRASEKAVHASLKSGHLVLAFTEVGQ